MTTTKRRRRSPADWMDLRPSELMDLTPSDWMEMTFGDVMSTRPSEWLETAYGPAMAAYAPAMAAYAPGATAYTPGATAWQRPWQQRRRGRDCGCDDRHEQPCPRCAPDPCQCECCIGDVDFAIYARVGETRVIPIVIENDRRREKQVKLELSDWTTRGGKAAPVRTRFLHPEGEIELAPCGSETVTLVVQIADDDAGDATPKPRAAKAESGREERQLPDVDDCLVAIADLRLEGCDHRPLRIAVAILPRDCDPYTVTCGCGCC